MRLSRLASVSLAALAFTLASGTSAQTAQPRAAAATVQARPAVPTQLPTEVRPRHYRLSIAPDAANMRFTGQAEIEVEVSRPTRSITLNAADLTFSRAALSPASGTAMTATGTQVNAEAQTATFTFAGDIAPGRYRLAIDYAGKINSQANGLFALDYTDGATQKRALFTQFEAPDARRMFPSWDEPQFRTPYDLSIVVPHGQFAVGNMPIASRVAQANGTDLVTFGTTPAMSSYLLFVGTGDLERITQRAGNTEVGVVSRRGTGEQGRYALESAARILPFYNTYFGTPFPLPKLDNIAGPGSSAFFGAMENWGAIFTFESILLNDPALNSEGRRRSIFSVAAHEMAHQWFGDLVTMAWWDDLWLNEGFASWMESKATAALNPTWDSLIDRVGGREQAMGIDSVRTTHPVIRHVETPEQISQAFDTITYQKGEAVIAMLEDYVGEDVWRQGVRSYIAAHRLSNTQSDDLWREIERAARRPITDIAHDFTLQPGVPLVRVGAARCVGGSTQVTLTQGEFSRDQPERQALRWRVPVVASAGGAPQRLLIDNGTLNARIPGCGTLVVNYGQAGYYRTLYAADQVAALTRGFASLRPIDQVGLLGDSWALGLGGYQPTSTALDLAAAVPNDANPAVWSRVAGAYGSIYVMNRGDDAQQALASAYASRRLGPVLGGLGWTPRPTDTPPETLLRTQLISILGLIGDRAVVAEANRRFAAQDASVTSGPLRETILDVVATNADAATWDRLHQLAQAERNPLVRQALYGYLAEVRDPALARRALELALTDEPGQTISAGMVSRVAGSHPDMTLDFALANRERVEALVDTSSRSRFFPQLAGGSNDPAAVQKLRDYADRYLTAQSRAAADQAIASIQTRVQMRQQRLGDIQSWLAAHRG